MSQKVRFVEEVQAYAAILAGVIRHVRDLKAVYTDRGYAASGSDPIINSDIVSTGATVVTLDACVVMFPQLLNFADDNPVTQGAYGETLNDMRIDV